MSDSALQMLAIWLFVPSLVVIVVLAVLQRNQVSRDTDPVQRQKQRAQLTTLARQAGHHGELVVDWINVRDLSKQDITGLLGKHGWHYQHQEIAGREWRLVFSRNPDADTRQGG